jgi:hypothetical protein
MKKHHTQVPYASSTIFNLLKYRLLLYLVVFVLRSSKYE